MTLDQMLADIYRRLAYGPIPAVDVTVRLTAFVNEAMQDVMAEQGLGEWITRNVPPITFTSQAGLATYGLQEATARITAVTDWTNDLRLTMRPFDWYRWQEPDPTANSGTPTVWVPLGHQAVSQQPTAPTGLWVDSTSPADAFIPGSPIIPGPMVLVDSVRTGGLVTSGASGANGLQGTTKVPIDTAGTAFSNHEQITKFYLNKAAVGTVSLWNGPSALAVRYAVIPPGRLFARYLGVALWPTPSSALPYTVDGEREFIEMTVGADEPPLPLRFHRILIEGALMREYAKRGDTNLAVMAERHYDRIMGQLRYFVQCPQDFLPSRQMWPVERSRLGPQFPATRWPW